MDEIQKKFFSIGEVSEMIGEAPSLIRFWEKEFPQLNPQKTEKGTRKYSRRDIELIRYIHHLVKEKGYTLEGAREAMKKDNRATDKAEIIARLTNIKTFLEKLSKSL